MEKVHIIERLMEQVKLFPTKPGVYIMKNSLGNVIYIGKAKKLRNRVMQYFYHSKSRLPKIDAMISNINSIEYILTDTELEAFLPECRLIKEIKPRYNSQMKNDRKYLYIKISVNEKYPRISIENKADEASKAHEANRADEVSKVNEANRAYKANKTYPLFFGPYTSRSSVERTVSIIKENFLIRKCSSASFGRKSSGCLNYSLGKCMGVCRNDENYDAYRKCISHIVLFLEGKDDSILQSLEEKLIQAAEKLEFEKAAKYRDDIRAIKHVLNKQNVIQSSTRKRNVIAIENIEKGRYKIFLFKGNRMISSEPFSIGDIDKSRFIEYLNRIIMDGFKNKTFDVNDMLGQQEIDEAQIIYSYLKRKKNDIMSYWIPSSWLAEDNPRLISSLEKIIEKIL